MLGAHARVLVVVVELAREHVLGQSLWDDGAVGAVAVDQVLDVIRDHRREPARLLARVGDVVRDVARRADDALERGRVAAGLLGGLPRGGHDPLDDVGVGELDDHAVPLPAGDRERLGAVARDVHLDLRQLRPDPLELQVLAVPVHLLAVHERLDHLQRVLELGDLHGVLADVAARRVPAPDAHDHAPVGDVVERRVRAREHRRLARARVRDEVAELDLRRLPRRDREQRDRLLPEHVRVVRPRVLEAVLLCDLNQLEPAAVRRIGQDGDAEAEH